MRTLLVTAAAIALVASTAAAANFDINGGDLPLADSSTGSVTVEDCTQGIHLDVLRSDAYDPTIDDWHVTGVRLAADEHHNNGATLGELCANLSAAIAIDALGINLVELAPQLITAASTIVEFVVPDGVLIPVASVLDTAVSFDHDAALADTDGDGFTDADEIAAGSDPVDDTSTPGLRADQCPDAGTFTDDGHCYLVVAGGYTWGQARVDAAARGGHVATVSSAVENAVLRALYPGTVPWTWLGGYQINPASNSSWEWIDGSPWTVADGGYVNWGGGEPNNTRERAVHMWSSGSWNDLSETSRLPYFLECEGSMAPNRVCGSS